MFEISNTPALFTAEIPVPSLVISDATRDSSVIKSASLPSIEYATLFVPSKVPEKVYLRFWFEKFTVAVLPSAIANPVPVAWSDVINSPSSITTGVLAVPTSKSTVIKPAGIALEVIF